MTVGEVVIAENVTFCPTESKRLRLFTAESIVLPPVFVVPSAVVNVKPEPPTR